MRRAESQEKNASTNSRLEFVAHDEVVHSNVCGARRSAVERQGYAFDLVHSRKCSSSYRERNPGTGKHTFWSRNAPASSLVLISGNK